MVIQQHHHHLVSYRMLSASVITSSDCIRLLMVSVNWKCANRHWEVHYSISSAYAVVVVVVRGELRGGGGSSLSWVGEV